MVVFGKCKIAFGANSFHEYENETMKKGNCTCVNEREYSQWKTSVFFNHENTFL